MQWAISRWPRCARRDVEDPIDLTRISLTRRWQPREANWGQTQPSSRKLEAGSPAVGYKNDILQTDGMIHQVSGLLTAFLFVNWMCYVGGGGAGGRGRKGGGGLEVNGCLQRTIDLSKTSASILMAGTMTWFPSLLFPLFFSFSLSTSLILSEMSNINRISPWLMVGINLDWGYSSAAQKPAINHLAAILFLFFFIILLLLWLLF